MNKKFRKLILPASLLLASQTFALGLGGLQVDSALDEVLNGEIPFVVDSSEEIESIEVSVASFAEYEKVGLDKSYVPSNIQVGVIERNGQKYVQISSIGPVSEPIVSLLLVVDWSNGHLLREYTILLDPPLFNNAQTNEYSKPVETNTYVAPQQIESQTQPIIQERTQIRNNNYNNSSQVIVESGDTLWKIASRYNDGNSPQQIMVAIFNNNAAAFLNDDMNQLREGVILTIPDSNQVSMISNGQAASEVRSHMQKWSRMQTEDSSSSSNNTSTTDYGIELIPPSDSDSSEMDYSSGTSANNRANTQAIADLNRAKEQLTSSNLENSELSSRVSELEKIIEDQKLALSLKDSDLAQLQEMIKEDGQPGSTGSLSEETMATDDVWDGSQSAEMDESMNDSMDETMNDSMDETMNDSMVSEVSTSDDALVIEDVGKDNVDTQLVVTQPVKKELSLLDKIMQYKFEGLIGLGVLLLGILGLVFFKRKGSGDELDSGGFLDSISNDDSDSDELEDLNSPLDSNSTELDLTNLEDLDELDNEELSGNNDEDSAEVEDEPEVVVMDDSDDELDEGLDDLEELDLDLGFGLDDDLEEGLELNSGPVSEQINEEPEELDNMEMEFDLEGSVSGPQEELGSDDLDLSLDFELDDLDLDDETTEEFEFDFEVSSEDLQNVTEDPEELDDLVFDTGERTIVDAVETISEDTEETVENASEDLPGLEFDLPDDLFDTDDLDLELDEDLEIESGAIDNDDVTELNLETLAEEDLNFEDSEVNDVKENNDDESNEVEPTTDEDIDIGLDFDDLASDDAIDTKLDLAKAYFEMGDIDGAQQMVNEIIEEGNEEQKSKAESLKSDIKGS